jgi:hypothetical protein
MCGPMTVEYFSQILFLFISRISSFIRYTCYLSNSQRDFSFKFLMIGTDPALFFMVVTLPSKCVDNVIEVNVFSSPFSSCLWSVAFACYVSSMIISSKLFVHFSKFSSILFRISCTLPEATCKTSFTDSKFSPLPDFNKIQNRNRTKGSVSTNVSTVSCRVSDKCRFKSSTALCSSAVPLVMIKD